MVTAPPAPSYAVAVGDVAVARGDLTALLGAAPANAPNVVVAPAGASRFQLLGIVAPKYPSEVTNRGVALIAVDGKMPKAYAVGARVDGEMLLKSVSLRAVSIGNAGGDAGAITLELPPLVPAATGTLSGATAPAGPYGGARTGPRAVPQITPQITPQLMPQAAPPQPAPAPEGNNRPPDPAATAT